MGPEISGDGDVHMNLEIHGPIFDISRGDAEIGPEKQIGLTEVGNKSFLSHDVVAAWASKRHGRGAPCWVTKTRVSLN